MHNKADKAGKAGKAVKMMFRIQKKIKEHQIYKSRQNYKKCGN